MTNNFQFPNIEFTETVLGPTASFRPWREEAIFIGDFSRGPVGATRVTSRAQFDALFGEDRASGSAAVQQAIQMGLTNITVKRAVLSSSPAKTTLAVATQTPFNIDPVIGFIVSGNALVPNPLNRTIGIEFTANYVGSPLTRKLAYGRVTSEPKPINHPSFRGRANIDFYVINFIDGVGNPTTSLYPLSVTHQDTDATVGFAALATDPIGTIKMIKIAATEPSLTLEYAIPGYVLRCDDANVASQMDLLVLSPPKQNYFDDGATGILVKLVARLGTLAVPTVTINDVRLPQEGRYIMGYRVNLLDQSQLTPRTALYSYFSIDDVYTDANSEFTVDGYFDLPATFTTPYVGTDFKYLAAPIGASASSDTAVVAESFGTSASEGVVINWIPPATIGGPLTVALLPGGIITVPIAYERVLVGGAINSSSNAFARGTRVVNVLRDIETALFSNSTFSSLFEDTNIANDVPPYTIEFVTKLLGTEANRINFGYRVYTQLPATVAEDILFKLPSETAFADPTLGVVTSLELGGAIQEATTAYRDFYSIRGVPILRVESLSPGTSPIRVSITPGFSNDVTAEFTLTVNYSFNGKVINESFLLNNQEVDAVTGIYSGTSTSSLVNAYFLPIAEPFSNSTNLADLVYTLLPLRTAPPIGAINSLLNGASETAVSAQGSSVLQSIPLLYGANTIALGATSQEVRVLAYLNSIKEIESIDAAYVGICGLSAVNGTESVFQEIFDQVNRSTVDNGLRIAVLELPAGSNAKVAESVTKKYASERVVFLRGHCTMQGNKERITNVSGVGYYIGLRVGRAPFVSSSASTDNFFLRSVLSVDTLNDSTYLNDMTIAKAEVLFFDSGLKEFKFLNGINTSRDANKKYVSVRATVDQILTDLRNSLQYVRSESLNTNLANRAASSCDAYLQQKLRDGYLSNLYATVATVSAQAQLRITIRFTVSIPADFIKVNVISETTESFTLNTL